MGARYLVSGVQLGMLISVINKKEKAKLISDIEENQFVSISAEDVVVDALKCRVALLGGKK